MLQRVFNLAINSTGRVLLARDRLLGRVARGGRIEASHPGISRHVLASGNNHLDAVLVQPGSQPAQASVLICHGIGETVQHWLGVQRLLAAQGVASLVFDYSGYGRSTGSFSAAQSEQDAIAAFMLLQRQTAPSAVSVLGFSLGSGPAAAMMGKVQAHRLILCAAFTSLRKAAACCGLPRMFVPLVPPVWDAHDALRACQIPVLIVHGEKDRVFPIKMAAELSCYCGPQSKLVIAPNVAHNEPFRRPRLAYWGLIADWLLARG